MNPTLRTPLRFLLQRFLDWQHLLESAAATGSCSNGPGPVAD
jgi:hypothetical protein